MITMVNSRGREEQFTPIPLKGKVINLVGKRFGKLAVQELLGRNRNGKVKWLCKCDCGKKVPVEGFYLRNGHTVSCGCRQSEKNIELRYIHGMSQSNEHSIYRKMIDRCHQPKNPSYKYYGAKGVSVCNRWILGEEGLNGFQCFYKDMGPRPSKEYSLDRFPDYNGNYKNGNVRWATRKQQARNTKATLRFMWNGKMMSFPDICDLMKIKRSIAYARIKMGWDLQRAVTQINRNSKIR